MIKCKHCEQTWHTSSQCFLRPIKKLKPCKFCQSTSHPSWQCSQKPKRKIEVKQKPVSEKKAPLKIGRITRKWLATRRAWFKANKADHYICYLCCKWMLKNETTLDHIKSRSRHPELRFELSNLLPACSRCNTDKGSKSLEEMLVEGVG